MALPAFATAPAAITHSADVGSECTQTSRLDRLLQRRRPPVMLDGGFATECERLGHCLQSKLWSAHVLVTHPEDCVRVHTRFLESGCDVISTASYQAARVAFENAGITGWEDHLRRSVDLAVQARAEYERAHPERAGVCVIAASLGPLGAVWGDGSEFTGTYGLPSDAPLVPLTAELVPGRQSLESIMDFHRERLRVIDDTPADILAFETVPCVLEVRAICNLLANEFPHRRAWISCSCQSGTELASGEPLAEVARIIASTAPNQVVAIGVNCCHPAIVKVAVALLRSECDGAGAAHLRVLAYPNRGELWDAATPSWYSRPWTDPLAADGTPAEDDYVRLSAEWRAAGAWAVGGCCRTTPELLAKVHAAGEVV